MARRRSRPGRIGGDYSLGLGAAEVDPLLSDAFYDSSDYRAIEDPRDPRCFVIARTGAGKSAALQRLHETHTDKVIRIAPEDLSLPYITDLQVFRRLEDLGVHLDLFFVALWKHVFLVELIRHRYRVDSMAAKQNFLADLRNRIKRDRAKLAALDYLDEFEGRFWCETDERVREITQRFENSINAAGAVQMRGPLIAGGGGGGAEATHIEQAHTEEIDRYQRVVNEFQLARLNKMIAVLDDNVLDSPQLQTYIVIDDLDRQWVETRVANNLIRCLFRAMLDLKRVRHLKVIAALRTNIFQQLDFGVFAGGQVEKLNSLVLPLHWTPYDLKELVDRRVSTASQLHGMSRPSTSDELLPASNRTRGQPFGYLLDRTLMRPRDVISFLNEALKLARGSSRISWTGLQKAEPQYSEGRLAALADEWTINLPDLERVLRCFTRAASPMTRDEFTERLQAIMLLPADSGFRGTVWVTALSMGFWTAMQGDVDWFQSYLPLTKCLYNIGFVGCGENAVDLPTYSYQDPTLLDRLANLHSTTQYLHIHSAFRMALNIVGKGYRRS